jgi:phosphopantetheinyl transferase (holo-ACP synthase)
MIGIDITRISRFQETKHLEKFLKRYKVDGTTPTAAAKTWACIEAIIKAEGKFVDATKLKIVFNKFQRPILVDVHNILSGSYTLTLSHDGDILVAVALKST